MLNIIPQWGVIILATTATIVNLAPSSKFVYSSIPSWQILTAHAQPLKGARDLAFCLKVPLDSLLVWVSSEGSGETARMRRLAWTFAARIGDKYKIRLTRSILLLTSTVLFFFLYTRVNRKNPQLPVYWAKVPTNHCSLCQNFRNIKLLRGWKEQLKK